MTDQCGFQHHTRSGGTLTCVKPAGHDGRHGAHPIDLFLVTLVDLLGRDKAAAYLGIEDQP